MYQPTHQKRASLHIFLTRGVVPFTVVEVMDDPPIPCLSKVVNEPLKELTTCESYRIRQYKIFCPKLSVHQWWVVIGARLKSKDWHTIHISCHGHMFQIPPRAYPSYLALGDIMHLIKPFFDVDSCIVINNPLKLPLLIVPGLILEPIPRWLS